MGLGFNFSQSKQSAEASNQSGFDVIEPNIVEVVSSLLGIPYAQSVLGSQLQAQDRLTRLTNSRVGGGQGFVGSRVPERLGGPRPQISSLTMRNTPSPTRNFSAGTGIGAPVMQNADFGPGALPFGNIEDILGLTQGTLNINDILLDSSSTSGRAGGGGTGGQGFTNQFGQSPTQGATGRDVILQQEYDDEIPRLLDEKRAYVQFLTNQFGNTLPPDKAQAAANNAADNIFEQALNLAAQGAAAPGINTADELFRAEEDIYNVAQAGFTWTDGELSVGAPGYGAIGTINGFIINPIGGREAAGPPTSDRAGAGIRGGPGPGEVMGGRAFGDLLTSGRAFSENDLSGLGLGGGGGGNRFNNPFGGGGGAFGGGAFGGGGPGFVLGPDIMAGDVTGSSLGVPPGSVDDSANRIIGGGGGGGGNNFAGPILSDKDILSQVTGIFGSIFGPEALPAGGRQSDLRSNIAVFNPDFEASLPIGPNNPLLMISEGGIYRKQRNANGLDVGGAPSGGFVDFNFPLTSIYGGGDGGRRGPGLIGDATFGPGIGNYVGNRNTRGWLGLPESGYTEVLRRGALIPGEIPQNIVDLIGANPSYLDVQNAATREVDRLLAQNESNRAGTATAQTGNIQFGESSHNAAPGTEGFAHGGIVTQPTVTTLGEQGPEAVVPLNRPDILQSLAGLLGGGIGVGAGRGGGSLGLGGQMPNLGRYGSLGGLFGGGRGGDGGGFGLAGQMPNLGRYGSGGDLGGSFGAPPGRPGFAQATALQNQFRDRMSQVGGSGAALFNPMLPDQQYQPDIGGAGRSVPGILGTGLSLGRELPGTRGITAPSTGGITGPVSATPARGQAGLNALAGLLGNQNRDGGIGDAQLKAILNQIEGQFGGSPSSTGPPLPGAVTEVAPPVPTSTSVAAPTPDLGFAQTKAVSNQQGLPTGPGQEQAISNIIDGVSVPGVAQMQALQNQAGLPPMGVAQNQAIANMAGDGAVPQVGNARRAAAFNTGQLDSFGRPPVPVSHTYGFDDYQNLQRINNGSILADISGGLQLPPGMTPPPPPQPVSSLPPATLEQAPPSNFAQRMAAPANQAGFQGANVGNTQGGQKGGRGGTSSTSPVPLSDAKPFGSAASGVGALPGTLGLADGGIVNQPTPVTIGEAGPEAVIPLPSGAPPVNQAIAIPAPPPPPPGVARQAALQNQAGVPPLGQAQTAAFENMQYGDLGFAQQRSVMNRRLAESGAGTAQQQAVINAEFGAPGVGGDTTAPPAGPPGDGSIPNEFGLTPGSPFLNSRSFEEETAFWRNIFANGFMGTETIPQILADLGMPIDVNGGLTPEQEYFIQQATQGALESGFSNVDRESTLAMETLMESIAPSLGLRGTDTPILDRGGRIQREAIFAKGQLQNEILTNAFNQRLNLPIETATTNAQLNLQRLSQEIAAATGMQESVVSQILREFDEQSLLTGQSINLAGTGANFLSNLINSSTIQTGATASGDSESEGSSFGVGANIGLG